MNESTTPGVREIRLSDAPAWKALYGGYREFYRLAPDDQVVERVWGWVTTHEHRMLGLVAVDHDDEPIGLANLRHFARPSSGTMGLYLDDLFTAPAARARGAATALLHAAAAVAAEEGASLVRWITADSNAAARRVYDAVAIATPWVTYDLPPAR